MRHRKLCEGSSRTFHLGLALIFLLPLFVVLYNFSVPDAEIEQPEGSTGNEAKHVNSWVTFAFASYYDLKIANHRVFPEPTTAKGGAIESISSSELLLVDGGGRVFLLERRNDELVTTALPSPTALLNPDFLRQQSIDAPQWYRVTDALVAKARNQSLTLYVSYIDWDPKGDCIGIGVAETQVDLKSKRTLPWLVRYRTKPCLMPRYLSNESGGRLAFYDQEHLLLTVGVLLVDDAIQLKQQHSGDYGKILLLDRNTWSSRVFSAGHRNPQGLLVERTTIWETEHGPLGGDELNIVEEDADYGWPRYSYGTDYGQKNRGVDFTVGDHSGARMPFYTWTPSIGVSNLLRVTGEAFKIWRDDLLIGSLIGTHGGKSLYRLRIADGRVLVSEQIYIGRPVRDLVEMPGGELALWDGRSILQILSPGNHVMSDCAGCHPHRWNFHKHGTGPQLMDVFGSDVARHKDFEYSPAMAAFEGEWTAEMLNRFLADPAGTIPGTRMNFPGIKDSRKRSEIIKYLKTTSSR